MSGPPATLRPGRPRVPALALVGGGICSVQFGSAIAAKLFAAVGSSGAVLLRLSSASIVLIVLWRPHPRGFDRRQLRLAGAFGLVLAAMNLTFYAALARIPLGVAVTIEFIGPLTVALGGSRRPRDLVWVALAVAGILALTRGGTGGLDGTGIALALLAGAFWGCYILLSSRVGRTFRGGTGLALAMPVAGGAGPAAGAGGWRSCICSRPDHWCSAARWACSPRRSRTRWRSRRCVGCRPTCSRC